MKRMKHLAKGLFIVGAVAYGAALGALYLFQRDFQYIPFGPVLALDELWLPGVEAVEIPTAGGQSVFGWHGAPQEGKPLILYYKGNGGNFTLARGMFAAWMAEGYGFLAFDYRGYPASPGVLSQENLLADALAVFDWAKAKGAPIVIWGHSLGSGPATYAASRREAEALLLEAPFLSAVSVAAERYPFAPVKLLMKDQYPADAWIAAVEEPVFVAHGARDRAIGVANGERLSAVAPNLYALWIAPEAGHDDLWSWGLWERAKAFFAAAEAARP